MISLVSSFEEHHLSINFGLSFVTSVVQPKPIYEIVTVRLDQELLFIGNG